MKLIDEIINDDCLNILPQIPSESIHLILSDIPYGIGIDEWDVLHNNTNSAFLGTSPAQEKAGHIFKKRGKPLNGWSSADKEIPLQYYKWCKNWSKEWLRVLKPGGSAIVFAGRRLAHRCITALEDTGFIYKDMLSWYKEKAPHKAQRVSVIFEKRKDYINKERWEGWKVGNLRPRFEPILWFIKPYKIGTTIADNLIKHQVGAFNESSFIKYNYSPDNILYVHPEKEDTGLHPTQKPLKLMLTLIELTTIEEQIVLDPFCGSGTTLLAAALKKRHYIGIEIDPNYANIARKRISEHINNNFLFQI